MDNSVAPSIALPRVTGRSLPPCEFNIPIVHGKPTAHALRVAQGQALGQLVRGYLSPQECNRIVENFELNRGKRARADGVAGVTIGADLYGKKLDAYLAETRAARPDVEALFRGTVDVTAMLRADIQATLGRGVTVRQASHQGEAYNTVRGVRWTGAGGYSLPFHDDAASLSFPGQRAGETALVEVPNAYNIYPSVAASGGELEIINVQPDDETRRRLGIEHTGFPYPVQALATFDRLVIRPEPGDLLILAGAFCHGVRSVGPGLRLLLNHFGGFIAPDTFVTWS